MKTTLMDFTRRTVREMREHGQYSAAKTCLSAVRGLLAVAHNEALPLCGLTPALLKAYKHHLLARQRSRNTVSLYMRTLQNICHRATRQGVAHIPDGLFARRHAGTEPMLHRAVTPAVIHKLRDAELTEKNARLAFARDVFMLSFYLRGIPFIDLAHLRKCDLRNGVIIYRRRKTGQAACVRLEPCALQIIRRYAPLAKGTPYLLPFIRRQGTADQEQCWYESALRLYNKHLNLLSERLELGVRLTSYVARHSWATIAHDIGEDVADISAALCHSSEKMTRNYLQSFSPDRLADVNRRVLGTIDENKRRKTGKKQREKRKIPKEIFYSGSL